MDRTVVETDAMVITDIRVRKDKGYINKSVPGLGGVQTLSILRIAYLLNLAYLLCQKSAQAIIKAQEIVS